MRNPAPSRPSSGAAARVGSSAIRDLLALTQRPEVISLAGGLPSPEAFPAAELAEAAARILAHRPEAALQYATTEGHPGLRAWISGQQPVPTDPDQVLVTAGSQQALELVTRALVAPGETVALADPGYVGAVQAFRLADADLLGVPSDRDGLCVDRLADRLAEGVRPRLVYVVAEFDNPTGATLADERRGALAALADRYGFVIVEDDPYGRLRWRGTAPASLATRSDRVVTLGTTSKLLAPGLRVGWAVAPPDLRADLVILKQAADLHTSSLSQHLAADLLGHPTWLDGHVAALRARYRGQAEALVAALTGHLGGRIEVAAPDGGMFCWARIPGTDTTELLPRALEAGTAFVPGAAFAVDAPHPDALRLSFATAGPAASVEAARRLARALTAS